MTLTLTDGSAVSPFGFGTMQWGGKADATESRALYDACRAAGITHFDTAFAYTDGHSETLLGEFAGAERDALYIATKVAAIGGSSRANILEQWETCKSRLAMDSVDLLYLHRWDNAVPLEETFETMAELQQSGQIRHIGVSNYSAWQVMKAQCVAGKLGTRIDAVQPMYNLVKRQAEVEMLPMCASEGIAAIPYSPLGGGLLTGKYGRGEGGRLRDDPMYAGRYAPTWMFEAAAALGELAAELGQHPATLAVAWVAAHSAGPMPLISARSVAQLEPSLAALSYRMSPEVYARITALTPTPPPATDRLEEA